MENRQNRRTAKNTKDNRRDFGTARTSSEREGRYRREKSGAEGDGSFSPSRPKSASFASAAGENPESIHGSYENGAVIGRNAVRELLKSGRDVDKLLVQRGEHTGSLVVLVAEATERGIPVIETEKAKLDAVAGYAPHQGVIAYAAEKEYSTVEDLLRIAEERGEAPLLVICDGITDPYNLGAVIRCADCCGAHGIIIPKRRAVGLTPLVTKASAGAIEHMAIAKVSNIASTVEALKKRGIWVYAAEAGGVSVYDTDFSGPCAIVLGSEGNGVSQIVRNTCDAVVSIPMYGKVNSFNVSAAGAILLAAAAHSHHKKD